MPNLKPINLLFDMETADPDDVMTLCFLTSHPRIALRAVTVTPGTRDQIGLVRHVLHLCDHDDVPVGSHRPDHPKNCVSHFHRRWLGDVPPGEADDLGHRVIAETIAMYPDLTVLTGAPLKNFAELDPEVRIERWVAQGGFAGDNIVPEAHRLAKFDSMLACATYNFNGAPQVAEALLKSEKIRERRLISKNVCHGMVYDQDFPAHVEPVRQANPGMELIWKGMEKYLERRPEGKKFHDPLAACAVIEPDIFEFCEVEMYRSRGKWGANPAEGSRTFISILADRVRFLEVFTTV